jgi:pilus assembly protein Flp/PilA
MNNLLIRLYLKAGELIHRDEAQDLVEYALIVGLLAFGATAGMKNLASGVNTAFNGVSTKLGTYVT